MHKVFRHGSSRIRHNVLKRSTVTGSGGYDDGILHRTMFLQTGNHFCHRRCLLSDCHVDADHIFAFLVDDRICGNGCLSGLAVSDDQLTLSAANREHGIDCQNTGFHRCIHGFTLYDARSLLLDGAVTVCLDRTFSVNRLTQSIYHTADEFLAHWHAGFFSGPHHFGSFFDPCIFSKQNDADLVSSDILHHTLQTILKGNNLAVHRMINAVDIGDSVTDIDDRTCLLVPGNCVIVLYFFFQNRNDFF